MYLEELHFFVAYFSNTQQRRRIIQKSVGGGAASNSVDIICPLFWIGLTDLPKTVPCHATPAPLLLRHLCTTKKKYKRTFSFKWQHIQIKNNGRRE